MCSSNTPKLDELALPEFHVTGNGGNCAIWKKKGIYLIALHY